MTGRETCEVGVERVGRTLAVHHRLGLNAGVGLAAVAGLRGVNQFACLVQTGLALLALRLLADRLIDGIQLGQKGEAALLFLGREVAGLFRVLDLEPVFEFLELSGKSVPPLQQFLQNLHGSSVTRGGSIGPRIPNPLVAGTGCARAQHRSRTQPRWYYV